MVHIWRCGGRARRCALPSVLVQIMRYACVVMLAGGDVTENVNVVEQAHGGSI